MSEVKFNWNGTNYTMYNDSLVLMMNFNNVSALSECTTRNQANCVKDVSKYGNNGTLGDATAGTDPTWTSGGKYNGAFSFDGSVDYINVADTPFDFERTNKFSIGVWINTSNGAGGVVTKMNHLAPINGFYLFF